MSDTNTSAGGPRPNVVIERTYRASVRELWDLWATKEGFESWWGPVGFRVEVHAINPRVGGEFHYDMLAATPEMVEMMKQLGRPASHESRGTFTEFRPFDRLAITHVIDFLPGVKPYDSTITVDFLPLGNSVRMVVTIDPMHDEEFTQMQLLGFTSQLSKLDDRFSARSN